MSRISFRPRGGQEGIECTYKEQQELANALHCDFNDEWIPLPNVSLEEQVKRFMEADETEDSYPDIYWENDGGKHGWCNSHTGRVVQWG